MCSVWDRLERGTDKDWQGRFQKHLAQFREAQRARAKMLQSQQPPLGQTAESCLAAKRSSEPFNLCLDINEYAEGLNLTDATLCSRRLEQLRMHALDAIIWMKARISYNSGWRLR